MIGPGIGGVGPRLGESRRLALVLLGPLVGVAMVWLAMGQSSNLKALAFALGPIALGVAWLRPQLAGACIAALAMVNAGAVIRDQYGVPNIVRLALILAGIALLLRPAFARNMLRLHPILIAFLAFAAIRILSAVLAPGGADAQRVVVDLAYGGLLMVVVATVTTRGPALRRTAELLVAVSALVATLTILKRLGVGGIWYGFAGDTDLTYGQEVAQLRSLVAQGDPSRVAGPLGDPNFWAQALVLVVPLGLWMVRNGSSRATRVCGAIGTVLIVAGIFLTGSRGGLISLVLAVSVWMWMQGRRWRMGIVAFPVLIIAAVVFTGSGARLEQLREVTNAANSQDPSIRGRLSESLAAFYMLRDHPLIGIGADQYPANYARYAADIGLDSRFERNAHDSYLQMAAESGLLGLGAFVGMLATTFVCGLRARRDLLARGDPVSGRCVEAVVAGLAGYALAAVFLHQAFPDYLWLAMGLTAGAYLLARDPEEAPVRVAVPVGARA